QLGVGPALAAADHGQSVRVGRGAFAQPGAEGLVTPISGRPVAGGERFRPDLDRGQRFVVRAARGGKIGSRMGGSRRHGSGVNILIMIMRMIIVYVNRRSSR